MKRNFLKRSLAFAVAAAMTVSSVPANLAFAEEEIIDEPLVIEEAIDDAEGADTGATETVQQIAASEPVAVQVEGVEQIGSEEVPADVAADASEVAPIAANEIAPVAYEPEEVTANVHNVQITNLNIEKGENENDKGKLVFDVVGTPFAGMDKAYIERYEVKITDSTRWYYSYDGSYAYFEDDYDYRQLCGDQQYTQKVEIDLNSLSAYAYNDEAGTEWYYNKNGHSLRAFNASGVAYSVSVRAIVRVYDEGDDEGIGYVNKSMKTDWVGPCAYTTPALEKPLKVAEVNVDENGVLTFNADDDPDRFEMKVERSVNGQTVTYFDNYPSYDYSTDTLNTTMTEAEAEDNCGEAYKQWNVKNNSLCGYTLTGSVWNVYQDMIDGSLRYDYAFREGLTYNIYVRGVNEDPDGVVQRGEWSAPVAYTVKTAETASSLGKVALRADVDDYQASLVWDKVPGTQYYEMMLTDATGAVYYNYYDWSQSGVSQAYVATPINLGNTTRYTISKNTSIYMVENGKYQTASDGSHYFTLGEGESDIYDRFAKDADNKYIHPYNVGTSYTFRVRAVQQNKETDSSKYVRGEWSDPITIDPAQMKPAQITGVILEDKEGTDDDELIWNKADHATGYQIEVVEKDASGAVVSTVKYPEYNNYNYRTSISMSNLITTPTPGNTYTIRIRGRNSYYSVMVPDEKDSTKQVSDNLSGDWSAEVVYSVSTIDGDNTPLGASVLSIQKENENSVGNSAKLSWSKVDNADGYEFLVKCDGREYLSEVDVKKNADGTYTYTPVYDSVNSTEAYAYVSRFSELNTYDYGTVGVSSSRVMDPTTKAFLTAYDPGKTYTVQVRAFREYGEWNATDKEFDYTKRVEGQWSNEVSYSVSALSPITDLALVQKADATLTMYLYDSNGNRLGREGDFYYFTYTADPARGKVYYQISEYPNFDDKPVWNKADTTGGFKLCIPKSEFEKAGTVYYVRAYNGVKEPTDLETANLNPVPNAVSFTTDAELVPKDLSGANLKVDQESSDSFKFTFNAVLEQLKGDYFELEYTNKATHAEADWHFAAEDNLTLNKSLLSEGTNYVRVRAYVYNKEGKKVYGAPSNEVTVTLNIKASDLTGFSYKIESGNYVFTYKNKLRKDETVEFQISDSKNFVKDGVDGYLETFQADPNNEITVYADEEDLTPGVTYYVRARAVSSMADTFNKPALKYGAWASLTIKPKVVDVTLSCYALTATSLRIHMSDENEEDYLSGYQIERKDGSKWKTLAYTTDNDFLDGGLKAQTKYSYRVRPYYYNSKAKKAKKKYVYGSYVYLDTMTWGNAMNLEAKAASKTSVKLSWDKVAGAEGYEIYRDTVTSWASSLSNGGYDSDSYEGKQLLKTITNGSTKSYTDKKLTSGATYSYEVRAYKTINKVKYYVVDTAEADLSMTGFRIISAQMSAKNGKTKLIWTPVYSAKGYLIEKMDNETKKWSTVKTIKKAKKTSYTLPASKDYDGIQYRIRAYKGNEYSNEATYTARPYLKTPTNVKAVAQKDGSIKITWKKVKGADYYSVHRTKSSFSVYDEDKKCYIYYSSDPVPYYVEDASMMCGYRDLDDEKLTGNTLIDRPIVYTTNGVENTVYEGPQAGVQYYYYVVAHRYGDKYVSVDNSAYYDSIGKAISGGSAAASAIVSKTTVKTPAKVKAKASAGQVKVSWKKVKGAKGYVVYRSTKKKTGFVPVGRVTGAKKVSYIDKTTQKGKTYYYKVCAYKTGELGAYVYSKESKVKSAKAK